MEVQGGRAWPPSNLRAAFNHARTIIQGNATQSNRSGAVIPLPTDKLLWRKRRLQGVSPKAVVDKRQ
eukprot:5522528-Alexandrium_andersonii.AAC.1